MANPLIDLLASLGITGAQPPAGLGSPPIRGEDTEDANPILVSARRRAAPAEEEPLAKTPWQLLGGEREGPPADKVGQITDPIPRKGMFGVKGTLRDILGLVGDAFLTQSGNKPVYAPQREQERLSGAMYGFTDNPMQAAERMATQDPAFAQKFYDAQQQNEARRSVAESQGAARQDMINTRREKIIEAVSNQARRTIGAVKTDEEMALAMQQIGGLLKRAGISPDEIGLGENMTPAERRLYAAGDMTVNQQQQIPISQQNADSNTRNAGSREVSAQAAMTNARRPRPTAQHEATLSNIDAQVAKAFLEGNATPAQQKYYEDRLTKGDSLTKAIRAAAQAKAKAGKGPLGADFSKYQYRQLPDGTWQRKAK